MNWLDLRRSTPARIALGRAGVGLPTAAHLDFQQAHALARDAVHAGLDADGIAAGLRALGLEPIRLRSAAADRATYLRRPDLGRQLDAESRALLQRHPAPHPRHSRESGNPGQATARSPLDPRLRGGDEERNHGVIVVIADGLSATAVNRHAVPLVQAVLAQANPRLGSVCVVEGGRVAIGDEIGGILGADIVAVLIGERPGLSAADSLGVYVTWQPAPGAVDAARNCLSNIRPEGMPVAEAAAALLALLEAARRYRMTGVGLSQRLAIERK